MSSNEEYENEKPDPFDDNGRMTWFNYLNDIWSSSEINRWVGQDYTNAIDDGFGHLVAQAFRAAIQ